MPRRLPFELTTACLYFADLPTRIRASHISRAWRDVALAERGLWTAFGCTTFMSEEDQLLMYDMLKIMLARSRPLPFRLQVPHSCFGSYTSYECSIGAVVGRDVQRLEEYDGPTYVFCRLYLWGAPLPSLKSFICRDHENFGGSSSVHDSVVFKTAYDGLRLPNVCRLVGPVLEFSGSCAPYVSLRDLVCTLPSQGASEHLFRCCPNIVSAEFLGVRDDVRLPLPPFPSTVRHITLHGEPDEDSDDDGVDFAPLLAWHVQNIPNLTLVGAQSVDYTILQFLDQGHHSDAIILRISPRSPEATLSADDGSRRWDITTSGTFWQQAGQLATFIELLYDRLAHLSICIEHLGEFFRAEFHVPRLVSLELCLTGVIDDPLPADVTDSDSYLLDAPGLQHLTLDISGSDDDVKAHEDSIKGVLHSLKRNFRTLLLYDADLLETVTVRSTARVVEGMKCGDFARFSRQFLASTDCLSVASCADGPTM